MWKLILSLILIVIVGLFSYKMIRHFKLTKNQILLFIVLTLFWFSISIIRSYRKTYAITPVELNGLGYSAIMGANISVAYGLVSLFIRLPLFVIIDKSRKTKIWIITALILLSITSLFVIQKPSFTTLYFSSLAMGVGASLLAVFNVMFAATFSQRQALLSVSILSIAPLLAEFIAAPFQYLATDFGNNFKLLWIISLIASIATTIIFIFFKSPKMIIPNKKNSIIDILKMPQFIVLCFIAIGVSFIKFATSGGNIVEYGRVLGLGNYAKAYLDVIFATFQLIGGVSIGLYLLKYLTHKKILQLGIAISLIFSIVLSFITNPVLLLIVYPFNALGYGISYNSLIGLAMQPFPKHLRYLSMGVFQTFFALGIFMGDKIYALILSLFPKEIFSYNPTQTIFLITILLGILLIAILQKIKLKDVS